MKLIAAILVLISTAAHGGAVYQVPTSRSSGGSISQYLEHVAILNARGTRVEIRVLSCSSACTLYLTADVVCASPRTRFGFHGPSASWVTLLPIPITNGMSETRHRYVSRVISKEYNHRWPGLGTWWDDRAAHRFGWSVAVMRGTTMNKHFGVPLCEGS